MNTHLNNWMDEIEGLEKDTTNKNMIKELRRQGFVPANHIDDKTGKPFIGWSKPKLVLREASNDVADSTYCTSCTANTGENIGHYKCVICGNDK